MAQRNRAEGWTHAKLSGHINEKLIAEKINSNIIFKKSISKRLKLGFDLDLASEGGLNEKNVKDVFGGNTKSKTDLVLRGKNIEKSNISIKKSSAGQVYLIGVERFIFGFEKQFNKKIPDNVSRAIRLFIAGAGDVTSIIKHQNIHAIESSNKIKDYELRKQRLTWNSLEKYDSELANSLLSWIKDNIVYITLFCFQRGLSIDKDNWANFIWYQNEVNEKIKDIIFNTDEMAEQFNCKEARFQIKPGVIGGGTTIKLPFGFLQWHQNQMQFHHQQIELMKNCSYY